MVRDVVTVDADYSVKYAARMMNYFGISSLVILSKGEVVGILTERDVMTRVVVAGRDPEKVRVREIMSNPVIVIGPTVALEQAVKVMLQRRIKKLPVMMKEETGSRLMGMLSLTDVARLQPQMLETMKELLPMGAQSAEESVDFYVR